MEEQAVVDRIVDKQHAVLLVGEEERERIVPVSSLPKQAKAGTWLRVQFEGQQLTEVSVDLEETARVQERIQDKMARLRKRGRHFRPLE